jgi:hypothetical protein
MRIDRRLHRIVAAQPYPQMFATISGAHLHGFPSPDSDFDLRGAHILPPGMLDSEVTLHESEHQRLRVELQAAHDASQLPEVPSEETRAALNDLLVRVRLKDH